MRGRLRLFVLVVPLALSPLVGACKRATPRVDAVASASASVSSAPPAASAPPPASRLRAPLDASFARGTVLVVGKSREGEGLVVCSAPPEGGPCAGARSIVTSFGEKIGDVDVFAGEAGLAVIVDADGGRVSLAKDAAGLGASWEASPPAVCATQTELVALGRDPDGGATAASSRPLSGEPGLRGQPVDLPAASLACGQTRAFVSGDTGPSRVARRLDPGSAGSAASIATLSKDAELGKDEERAFLVLATGDGLLAVRLLAKGGLATRAWSGDAEPGPWLASDAKLGKEPSIELVVASETTIGVVLSRPVDAARDCPGGEDDAIAELVVLDRATGKARKDPRELDRWTCGGDPGPFFGGVVGDRVVVAWPRGADTACSKLGVRHGGLGYLATRDGAGKIVRLDAPAEAFVDAGCDKDRCAVAYLARGAPGACVAGASPDAGEPRVLAFP